MTLDPQSEQNHYPMRLLVFTAICKEMFYWLPNPSINVLLLSNLLLVYSMYWKESAIWKAVVFLEEMIVAAFILEPGHGCVYHTKGLQMRYFITYSSIYCGEMPLLLSVFQRNKVLSVIRLHIVAPSNTRRLKLNANVRSICLYRNYTRIAFSFWILDCPKHWRCEVQNQSTWSVAKLCDCWLHAWAGFYICQFHRSECSSPQTMLL